MSHGLGPIGRWVEALHWIRRLRPYLSGDYDYRKGFSALLEEKSGVQQHLALPIAFRTLERVSGIDAGDIYEIDRTIQGVLDSLEGGDLTLRDGTTPVYAPRESASRIQVITLRRYDFSMFQQFEIELMHARTLRIGEHQMTQGFGLARRPGIKLHDSYPEGRGIIDSDDLAELTRRLSRTLDNPIFVDVGEYLTVLELEVALLIVRDLILHPEKHRYSGKNVRRVLDHLSKERSRRSQDWGVRAPKLFA